MTRRIALLLEYDGTGFAGSQLQSNARTVQGVLEAAMEKTTGEPARVAFAGRTDAGVHAEGQVASFVTLSALDAETLRRALNAWLPEDVVRSRRGRGGRRRSIPGDSAVRRRYRYVIDNRPVRPALDRAARLARRPARSARQPWRERRRRAWPSTTSRPLHRGWKTKGRARCATCHASR